MNIIYYSLIIILYLIQIKRINACAFVKIYISTDIRMLLIFFILNNIFYTFKGSVKQSALLTSRYRPPPRRVVFNYK